MKIRVEHVYYMPKELKPGVLYVSVEFGAAVHLCPCGCGSRVNTPLGPTDWKLEETAIGPTLRPSVGNWQETCKSHYWIYRGEIRWSDKWTSEDIKSGREYEEARSRAHYDDLNHQRDSRMRKFWRWVNGRVFQFLKFHK
jgi:hypothetical protein